MCTRTLVGGIFDASISYIYIWTSKEWGVAYVGQTAGQCGALGRAAQHLSRNGTLRVRFEDETGVPLERASDLELFSFRLPPGSDFCGVESSFREAVEYRVQIHLHQIKTRVVPRFTVLSHVRSNERVGLRSLQDLARRISDEFERLYQVP